MSTDDSSCLITKQLEDKLNPKCMSIHDWVETQAKDEIIGKKSNYSSPESCTIVKSVRVTTMR